MREGDGVATRRREPLSTWDTDPVARTTIEAFTDARLLVTAGRREEAPTVEVAHEALLRAWPRLAGWIADKQEALRLRDRVRRDAETWAKAGRPDFRPWKHELLDPARRLLAEAGLLERLEQDSDTADFLIPEADRILAELLCSGTDHARREAIGLRLNEIGDPRLGVGVIDGVPDILWCPIPAGEVRLEGHGRRSVAPFHIAAYPVTFAQYKAFLDAEDGYRSAPWWGDLRREPEPGLQLRPYANYPADHVSWYDATAFCRWLSAKIRSEVRLPDEPEWQWAAQSACKDFIYPWGLEWDDGRANASEANIGRTTAVGMYPGGRSTQGVYDLAGNVWEWCRNLFNDLKHTDPSSNVDRVFRGGAWLANHSDARADSRPHRQPNVRGPNVGFRVCTSLIHMEC